jgi:hypothetical protein
LKTARTRSFLCEEDRLAQVDVSAQPTHTHTLSLFNALYLLSFPSPSSQNRENLLTSLEALRADLHLSLSLFEKAHEIVAAEEPKPPPATCPSPSVLPPRPASPAEEQREEVPVEKLIKVFVGCVYVTRMV